MPSCLPLLLLFLSFSSHVYAANFHGLGVNYGTLGNNLPPPSRSVSLLRSINAGAVKIYDANATIVRSLAGTNLAVSVMVPNQIIPSLASSHTAADKWIQSNILPHIPSTRIRFLLVGNEIISDYSIKNSTWGRLVPVMENLHRSLRTHGIHDIKVGTPFAMDALSLSFPPSSGTFRTDVLDTVIKPLLKFLKHTNSYYFVDAYPYFVWAQNYSSISVDYALFQGNPSTHYRDPGNGLVYTNLLDQMLDATIAAMSKLGYGDVKLGIAETGWPNAGDLDQIGCNVHNAAVYNRNFAQRMAQNPGTPTRPGVSMPIFVFSLYNENQKPGPGTERHWGLFYPNGSGVYEVDLKGRRPLNTYPPLPPPDNDTPYTGPIWCVLEAGKVNETAVADSVAYACGQGNGTCSALQPGKACYQPNTTDAHASYAFNEYWQQFRNSGGTCYFNGLAVQTAKDPSYGCCKFPSSLN